MLGDLYKPRVHTSCSYRTSTQQSKVVYKKGQKEAIHRQPQEQPISYESGGRMTRRTNIAQQAEGRKETQELIQICCCHHQTALSGDVHTTGLNHHHIAPYYTRYRLLVSKQQRQAARNMSCLDYELPPRVCCSLSWHGNNITRYNTKDSLRYIPHRACLETGGTSDDTGARV